MDRSKHSPEAFLAAQQLVEIYKSRTGIDDGRISWTDLVTDIAYEIDKAVISRIAEFERENAQLKYNPLSVDEDYMLPVPEAIDKDVSEMTDVEYLQASLYRSLTRRN